jgi:hypothetical protein
MKTVEETATRHWRQLWWTTGGGSGGGISGTVATVVETTIK